MRHSPPMAYAGPGQGDDGDAAGRAARLHVQAAVPAGATLRPAWLALADRLLPTLTDATTGPGRPEPPPGDGHRAFAGSDATRVEALVELAQEGDVEAFGQLYERSVETVYRYLYVRTGDRQLSEDLTSETFVRALRSIGSFRWQGRDIVAWFLTIARNLLLDARKSARFRLEVATDELLDDPASPAREPVVGPRHGETPEQVVLRRHHEQELVDALRSLTPDQAECVVLRFMEGLSLAECAEVLGRKENAVKQLQLRAVRALRKELGRAG